MKKLVIPISAFVMLSTVAACGQEERKSSTADSIVWGEVVNGLRLGISPPFESSEGEAVTFDGTTLRVDVHLRNASQSPISLFPSVYQCLAFGPHGASLVSHLSLQPNQDGAPLTLKHHGWNHLRLLDKRRPKSESWQETLCKSQGSDKDIQLEAEDTEGLSVLLAAGESQWDNVTYALGRDNSAWQLAEKQSRIQPGKYRLTAVLIVDHKLSKWKGKLSSGPLEVEITRDQP